MAASAQLDTWDFAYLRRWDGSWSCSLIFQVPIPEMLIPSRVKSSKFRFKYSRVGSKWLTTSRWLGSNEAYFGSIPSHEFVAHQDRKRRQVFAPRQCLGIEFELLQPRSGRPEKFRREFPTILGSSQGSPNMLNGVNVTDRVVDRVAAETVKLGWNFRYLCCALRIYRWTWHRQVKHNSCPAPQTLCLQLGTRTLEWTRSASSETGGLPRMSFPVPGSTCPEDLSSAQINSQQILKPL